MRRPVAFLVSALMALTGCSIQDGPTGTRAPTTTRGSTTTAETTTTTATPLSTAVVTIGPARYELDAICAAGGAGEIAVRVEGFDVNGLPVVGQIQAFVGAPYIGLQVGEGEAAVLFEPRFEGTLDFELVANVVEFAEVDFVTELDLATGEFVPAGIGTVRVECLEYVRELPEVPFS